MKEQASRIEPGDFFPEEIRRKNKIGEFSEIYDEDKWALLSEAYRFVFPLVLMDLTMKSATSVAVADTDGHAPANQLMHAQKLADADFKIVVTPNVDTIYTQIWVDLKDEPQVFVLPKTDRFCLTQILDAWTNTPAVLDGGSYLLAREGYDGPVPDGLKLVEIPTRIAWMITRVIINDEADMANVRKIQDAMRILPLSAYEAGGEYIPPMGEDKEEDRVVPVKAIFGLTPEQYFNRANALMADNPPYAEDADVLARFAELNIGPGLTFDAAALPGDIAENWKKMLGGLRDFLIAAGEEYQIRLGDWLYYGDPIARFGTAYDYRALVALGGLGANPTYVAIYARIEVDVAGEMLNGQNSYVLHFDEMPPMHEGGFWSATAYGSDDFLIANELDCYCMNDRSAYVMNEDGSLDIVLSSTAPENEANWLPVCADDFHLFLRIYLPDMEQVNGSWPAPTITKIEE